MESPHSESSDRTVSSLEASLGFPKELMKPDAALDRKTKKCSQVIYLKKFCSLKFLCCIETVIYTKVV